MLPAGAVNESSPPRIEYSGLWAMYVTNIADSVYVLHVFVKKSQKTPAKEIETAKSRLKAVRTELGQQS